MLQVYNTFTRKKEKFIPLKNKKIGIYVCGPTVYGPSHLGHARTYVVFDFIRRFFEFLNYNVKLVMNITDIHDDIIKEAEQLKISPQKLSEQYSEEFFKELEILKIKKSFKNPRVSEHIKEIIDIIKILIKKGCAYETEDGVYFRVSSLRNYGELSGRDIKKAITGTRVKTDKYEKDEAIDFALWKKTQPLTDADLTRINEDLIFESPWGFGRPGWHIECSAMSKKYMGIPFDIHGGAVDLIFPHHENEIAQSESAFGKKFVNYFLHSGLLYVDGKKMSKSLGNFTTINEFLSNKKFYYSARFLRFFILSNHWRSTIDFNEKTLDNAWNNFFAINEFIAKLKNENEIRYLADKNAQTTINEINDFKQKFIGFLKDDFNSAGAINYLLEFINKLSANSHEYNNLELLKTLKEFDKFFACFFQWTKLNPEIKKLIKQREELRKNNDFEATDKIRNQLQKQGIILQDKKEKTSVINLN